MVERTPPQEAFKPTTLAVEWNLPDLLTTGSERSASCTAGKANPQQTANCVYGNLELYDSTAGGTSSDTTLSACAWSSRQPRKDGGSNNDSVKHTEDVKLGEQNDIYKFLQGKLLKFDAKTLERISQILHDGKFTLPSPSEHQKGAPQSRLVGPDGRPSTEPYASTFDQILKHVVAGMGESLPDDVRKLIRTIAYLGLKPPAEKPSGEGNQRHILPVIEVPSGQPRREGDPNQGRLMPGQTAPQRQGDPNIGRLKPGETPPLRQGPPPFTGQLEPRKGPPPFTGELETRKGPPPFTGQLETRKGPPPSTKPEQGPPLDGMMTPEQRQALKDKLRRGSGNSDSPPPRAPVKERRPGDETDQPEKGWWKSI